MKKFFNFLRNLSSLTLAAACNWYETQIEIFSHTATICKLNSGNITLPTLSTAILKANSLGDLQDNIDSDMNACKEQLLMIYCMFEEMGLTQETAQQCLRLLIETENIPNSYIRTLCFLWHKYKLYTHMQEDLFNAPFLIRQNKTYIYNLFRYQLKPLLGINEEKDIVLKEHYKHQADISKSLELAYLTETKNLFANTSIIDNDCRLFDKLDNSNVEPLTFPDKVLDSNCDFLVNNGRINKSNAQNLSCLA